MTNHTYKTSILTKDNEPLEACTFTFQHESYDLSDAQARVEFNSRKQELGYQVDADMVSLGSVSVLKENFKSISLECVQKEKLE